MSLNAPEHRVLVAYPIDGTGAATHTVRTPTTGTRWILYYLHLHATAATNVSFSSGATVLTGTQAIVFAAAGSQTFSNTGLPLAVGRATGEAFTVTSSAAVDLDGWALLAEVPG